MIHGDPPVFTSVHEPVLGTRLVLRIRAVDEATATRIRCPPLADWPSRRGVLTACVPDL